MLIKKTSSTYTIDKDSILELLNESSKAMQSQLLEGRYFSFNQHPTERDVNTLIMAIDKQNGYKRALWTPAQDRLLNVVVYGLCLQTQTLPLNLNSLQWEQVARLFKQHNWKACRNRWLSERQYKMPWTLAEDKMLTDLQVKFPNRWCEISIELMKACGTPYMRQGKQCRDRWINKLDPNIVNIPWYKEEELRLFYEVKKRGKKWAEISNRVFRLRRTENTIKNRYYNLLKQEENKINVTELGKEEKEQALIDSCIASLQAQIANQRALFQWESNSYRISDFTYPIGDLVIIKGRKMQKLNEL